MIKIKVIDLKDSGIFNVLQNYFNNSEVEIISSKTLDVISENDCSILVLNDFTDVPEHIVKKTKVINIHPSLLPAFSGKDAIEQTFISGVKVGGVTIHTMEENNKITILAQYPVLIGLTTHVDEYIKEIDSAVSKLLPHVLTSIIEDRVFDFKDLFKTVCLGGGSSCSGCNHN